VRRTPNRLCPRRPSLRLAALLVLLVQLALMALPAHADDVVDRLSVPGPITFDGTSYRLAWSSHPSPDYFKQEYLPEGQNVGHYQRMLLLEAIVQGTSVDSAVSAKIAMLKKRKDSDPLVNFAVFKNPKSGEVILDFVLGSDQPGSETIVEWNAHRYAELKGKNGKTGVLLFGLSCRAYGDASSDFLRGLKSQRPADIDALSKYPLPLVRP
jgi:hypothetical protein